MSDRRIEYLKQVIDAQKWLMKRLLGINARLMGLCTDLLDGRISKKDAIYEHYLIEKSYSRARENFRELATPRNLLLKGKSLDEVIQEIGLDLPDERDRDEEEGGDEVE